VVFTHEYLFYSIKNVFFLFSFRSLFPKKCRNFANMRQFVAIISVVLTLTVMFSCTDKGDMRERLDYMSRCNRADTVFSEKWLPTVDSLVNYFNRHGNANERMMVYYLQGRVYYDMGEAPIALASYQKATEMADTTQNDCDLHTLAAIYGQMATLYHRQLLPDDEMNALIMAEKFAYKNKDTLAAITAYRLRTGVYFHRNDTDSMLQVTQRSVELYRQHGGDHLAAQILILPISIYLNRGQYQKAWEDMQIYEKESGFFDEMGNILPGKELFYYYKGLYFLSQNRDDDAIDLFRKTLSGGFMEAGYKGLLSAYEKKHIPDSIAKYARLFANANDDSYLGVEQDIIHQTSALYNYNRQQKIAEDHAREARTSRMWATFISLLGIITIVIGYKKVKSKAKQEIKQLSTDYENSLNQLYVAKDRLRLLNYDYEVKNRQLESEIEELKKDIAQANQEKNMLDESVNELQQRLSDLTDEQKEMFNQHKEEIKNKEMEIAKWQEKAKQFDKQIILNKGLDTEARFRESVIYKKFEVRSLSKHVIVPLEEKDWNALTEAFRTHYIHYYTFVAQEHHLPVNQFRLCMLIRLGFNNEQIRKLMNKDTQQVYRLKRLANYSLFGSRDASTLEENITKLQLQNYI
jgi:hypothetical protein